MNKVREQIERAIAENKGNVRDALNVTLGKLEIAEAILDQEKKANHLLRTALREIIECAGDDDELALEKALRIVRIAGDALLGIR